MTGSAPTAPIPAAEVLTQGVRLVNAFRAKGLPVVLVRVGFSADGGDALTQRVDRPWSRPTRPPDFAELATELDPQPSDIMITKRQYQHRVESTARAAHEHAYNLTIASDAVTDRDPDSHQHSMTRIFPKLAEIDTTDAILTMLDNG